MPSEKEQVSTRNADKAPPILKTGRMGGKQIQEELLVAIA